MNNPGGASAQQAPFHASPQCIDHRYMGSGAGGYFVGAQQQPYHHASPSMHPPNCYGGNSRQTNIIPTGGPPLVNAQYTNTFLMNCYQGAANGWAGVPLISTAKRRSPRNKSTSCGGTPYKGMDVKEFGPGSSMSKMALHAQGPPLILNHANAHGNCHGARNGNGPGRLQSSPSMAMRYRSKPHQNAQRVQQPPLNGGQQRLLSGHGAGNDNNNNNLNHHCDRALKFVADENSSIYSNSLPVSCSSSPGSSSSSSNGSAGNNNSGIVADACLPRIIKPRKRRKKERKPGIGGHATHDAELSGSHLSQAKIGSEEDFEDDEAVVSDFMTACSCHLCDPKSHIWSFPLRNVCPLQEDEGDSEYSPEMPGPGGNDLHQPTSGQSQKPQLHHQHQQQRAKDVGVIGGNRVNQQRSEWRGSPRQPPQMTVLCDNDGSNAKTDGQRDALLMGIGRGGALWPNVVSNDEEAGESFPNAFGRTQDDLLLQMHRPMMRSADLYCGLSAACSEEDEELLIENLANLLNFSSSESSPKDSPKSEPRNSDSSGVSSASDCGSVFGECYSPLVNLTSPPSIAFTFPSAGLFPMVEGSCNGLLSGEPARLGDLFCSNGSTEAMPTERQRAHAEEGPGEEEQQKRPTVDKQQHVLNCLDMDWYRAATMNRRLLMPYSNN